MKPACDPGIIIPTIPYNSGIGSPPPRPPINDMIAMITTRKRGKATTTVTNDSANIPSVSIFC